MLAKLNSEKQDTYTTTHTGKKSMLCFTVPFFLILLFILILCFDYRFSYPAASV